MSEQQRDKKGWLQRLFSKPTTLFWVFCTSWLELIPVGFSRCVIAYSILPVFLTVLAVLHYICAKVNLLRIFGSL